ncbi:MAG: hypothetical protein OEM23_03580 [Gemmatimonadota bacterium]|nr:hypothetical protein [Gemmatimonadota bacterium]MDH3427494.1 hypothetical protein [Gemmatimonadota bacterium]
MLARTHRDRTYRLAVASGIVVSVAVHVAVLAFGRLAIEGRSEADRGVRLVALMDPIVRDAPVEVVKLREPEATTGLSGSSEAAPAKIPAPAFASVRAAISAAIPNPLAALQKIEQAAKPENPVASYANITDFMADSSANPRPLRPMDDRPISVLAALSRAGSGGGGVSVGGGHCPAPGGPRVAFPDRILNF